MAGTNHMRARDNGARARRRGSSSRRSGCGECVTCLPPKEGVAGRGYAPLGIDTTSPARREGLAASLSAHTTTRPQGRYGGSDQYGVGMVLTWWGERDSNPPWTLFESAVSAAGLPPREPAVVPTWGRRRATGVAVTIAGMRWCKSDTEVGPSWSSGPARLDQSSRLRALAPRASRWNRTTVPALKRRSLCH